MAKIVGPAVAGLVIATVGLAAAFLVNGASFAAVLAGLLAMRATELRPADRAALPRTPAAVASNLAEGLRYAVGNREVLLAISLVGAVSIAGMNFQVLLPPLARDVLGTGASGYGFLMASSGVGAVLATLMIAFRGRPSPIVMPSAAVLLGVLDVVVGVSRAMPVSLVSMAIIGLSSVALTTYTNTLIQIAVPDHLRGRVMALYVTVHGGAMPIGGVLFGAIASAVGPSTALVIGGTGAVAVGLAGVAATASFASRAAEGSGTP
jgi:hypothetical protein